jgi:hypothetical protein
MVGSVIMIVHPNTSIDSAMVKSAVVSNVYRSVVGRQSNEAAIIR